MAPNAPGLTTATGRSQTLFQFSPAKINTMGMAIDGKKTQAKTTTVSRIVSPVLVVKKLLLLKLRSTSRLPTPLMARNAQNPISTIGRVKYGQQTHADAIRKIPIVSLVFIARACGCGTLDQDFCCWREVERRSALRKQRSSAIGMGKTKGMRKRTKMTQKNASLMRPCMQW